MDNSLYQSNSNKNEYVVVSIDGIMSPYHTKFIRKICNKIQAFILSILEFLNMSINTIVISSVGHVICLVTDDDFELFYFMSDLLSLLLLSLLLLSLLF